MAGKHSKNLFDLFKEIKLNNSSCTVNTERPPLLLPFKIIIAVLITALLLSTIWISAYFIPGKSNQNVLSEAAEIFNSNDSATALNMLMGKNNDIKGWIKINGTDIDYPVCQTDNNTYYMNHNHLGEKSRYGALFLFAEDSFERKGNDCNKVIYGNNMNDGTMFGSLKKFRSINFYRKNPTVNLYYGDKSETYVVFAVMLISSSENDNNIGFDPTKSYFEGDESFKAWFVEASQRSIIKTNIEVTADDDILTLVTLADDFEGARLVVMAKRLDDAQVPYIDTSTSAVNPNIKYPKIWYTEKGLEYPY